LGVERSLQVNKTLTNEAFLFVMTDNHGLRYMMYRSGGAFSILDTTFPGVENEAGGLARIVDVVPEVAVNVKTEASSVSTVQSQTFQLNEETKEEERKRKCAPIRAPRRSVAASLPLRTKY
jgi:hypothetical protein